MPRRAIIVPVPGPNTDLVQRFVELFNRDMADVKGEPPSSEIREVFVEEPVIVPVRAYLEDTEYSGPTALKDFTEASAETWTRVQIESDEIRELDRDRVLLVGTLRGTGRECGAEVMQGCAWLILIRDGKIAEGRTFLSQREALEAAQR
jgi:ketosteroid isomerase-like protein